jgi:NAD(P)-dependent dehydrogenase (short-subunit alcohol dehydrogenase family)
MPGPPVIVVTGAGGGLGRAVLAALRTAGATVIAVDRAPEVLDGLDPAVHRQIANVTDPDSVAELFAAIDAEFGPPDVVVHGVGAFRPGDLVESDPEDLRAMLDINLSAAWLVSQHAGTRMQAAGRGAIIHIGARNGIDASAGAAAYAISKAALLQLVRVLDAELSAVRVNAVVPALIDTPANRAALPAATMAHAVAPEAIATVIAFLASPSAAPINGAIIPVYGKG